VKQRKIFAITAAGKDENTDHLWLGKDGHKWEEEAEGWKALLGRQ